jgi:hypothetical protein
VRNHFTANGFIVSETTTGVEQKESRLDTSANLNSVVAELSQRYVAREEDINLPARSIVADCHMPIIGLPLRLDSAAPIP